MSAAATLSSGATERFESSPTAAKKTAIAVRDLEKTYPTQDGSVVRALGPANFEVSSQEFVSVVGPSGCGKSTLLKVLAGLVPANAGVATIQGEAVKGPRNDVGVVFQSPILLPWKTILANVLLPIKIRRRPVAEFRQHALDLLTMVGLEGFADRYPHELSGGMQQRAGIVRALVSNPDILLMDEPFGALDAITRDQLNLDLLDIWAKTRKTVLFITHGIAEAVFLSDRVLVMGSRPGRIIEEYVIDLPRPRHTEQVALPVFGEAVAGIRLALARAAPAATGRRDSSSLSVSS